MRAPLPGFRISCSLEWRLAKSQIPEIATLRVGEIVKVRGKFIKCADGAVPLLMPSVIIESKIDKESFLKSFIISNRARLREEAMKLMRQRAGLPY